MHDAKDTARALVRIGYDGSVKKQFRAANARERFENELRVLRYLEQRGCDFVPRVLSCDPDKLELVTTNCGARVDHIGEEKLRSLFAELESYGVRHDDPYMRTIACRRRRTAANPPDHRKCAAPLVRHDRPRQVPLQ